ncbi:MAG: hypothetical protein FJ311_14145 [Rhodospirillales bacterium]|nr:hypothetical protein [Rhodospirillales bacterium]
MTDLKRRLEKLEGAIAPVDEPWHRIIVGPGETTAEVVARTFGDQVPRNLIIRRIVEPTKDNPQD